MLCAAATTSLGCQMSNEIGVDVEVDVGIEYSHSRGRGRVLSFEG